MTNRRIPYQGIVAPTRIPDHSTASSALRLAERLTRYWGDLGFPLVSFWVDGTLVKSNLVNGVPPVTLAQAQRRLK